MDKQQKKTVNDIIEMEGFDYAFLNYSDFEDIEDVEFHKLRKEYLTARKRLADLIGSEV